MSRMKDFDKNSIPQDASIQTPSHYLKVKNTCNLFWTKINSLSKFLIFKVFWPNDTKLTVDLGNTLTPTQVKLYLLMSLSNLKSP
jgi:hypothetical protein